MGIGVSLLLIAVGAILTWAVSADVSGVDIQTIGVILLVVGAIGLVLSMVFWSSWGGPAYFTRRREYDEDAPPRYERCSAPGLERGAATGPPRL